MARRNMAICLEWNTDIGIGFLGLRVGIGIDWEGKGVWVIVDRNRTMYEDTF